MTLFNAERPLTLIGCGHMAGAMLTRWLATGTPAGAVQVVRPSGRAVADGVVVVTSVADLPRPAGAVLLAVKPQRLDEVVDAVRPLVDGWPLISILAGTTLASLAARFPGAEVVRAMPNLPVAGGDGVVGLCAADPISDTARAVAGFMAPLGLVEWLEEARFDALTALSGSGPAFLYRFVDSLAKAGAAAGLDPDQSLRLARATVHGAARVVAEADETPASLAAQVAAEGGSTARGMTVLEEGGALDDLVTRTIAASVARNVELAASTR